MTVCWQNTKRNWGTLPKGTISEKKVKQSTYYYLKYREGKKVISRYIPQKDVEAVREQVEKRRHIETMIRSLQEERAIARRHWRDKYDFISWQQFGRIGTKADPAKSLLRFWIWFLYHNQ